MRYKTLLHIVNNKKRLLYDNGTGSGTDTTNDPTAKSVNPNNFLPPVIGSSEIIKILIVSVLALASIYLIKKIFQ